MQDFSSLLVLLLIKILLVWYCTAKAKRLNRSMFGWFVFSFIEPIIAAIVIQFVSPKPVEKMEMEDILDA